MKRKQSYIKTNFGFLRVASFVPEMRLGNIEENKKRIIRGIREASSCGAQIIVFPELSITGYTLGDLFHQTVVQTHASSALRGIQEATLRYDAVVCVGLPLSISGCLYNVGAVLYKGKLLGFVPKTHIPGYKEFYEERWFASARDLVVSDITFFGERVPIGTDLLFRFSQAPECVLGVEICEDLWAPIPPSSYQAIYGATVVANLSASNELIGKAEYRRELVSQQSARGILAYIYASSGVHESTTDVIYGGHALICENGSVLAESERFRRTAEAIYADLDIEHIVRDREKMTSFGETVNDAPHKKFKTIEISTGLRQAPKNLMRHVDPHPFIPRDSTLHDERMKEIFSIQATGLAKRLENAGIKKMIIGLSGGLDSTLALLVCVKICELLGFSRANILAYTMPGFATTKRTKSNAMQLAEALGVSCEKIDITKGSFRQFKDIGHDGTTQDVTFQNVQARYRTMILMNKANQLKGIVVGTGDLSEIALGWNTFTGDHISHYNVNAGVPKTLVRHVVEWVSREEEFAAAHEVLADILATPISPELAHDGKRGVMQKTEELVGPYELHDFFLYHFLRWGSTPRKILYLARHAFDSTYSPNTITKWLKVFIERFFKNQWKRSVMPDGPKVGSVALSPRGDWRMPSDVEVALWLNDIQ